VFFLPNERCPTLASWFSCLRVFVSLDRSRYRRERRRVTGAGRYSTIGWLMSAMGRPGLV
jgi:hypothetical protein